MNRSSWHLRTGAIVFLWLAAILVVSLVHPFLPYSGWLLVHLLGLGAASNAILIWSWHFTETLLRRPPDVGRREQAVRLAVFNLGAVGVIAGVVSSWWPAVLAGGIAAAAVSLSHAFSLLRQLRRALPARFGFTVRYYVGAGVALPVGAGLGVAMANDHLSGELHERLVVAHAAINLFGWVGLTVLGTLVTLWPTMLRTRMADGVERAARRGLPPLIVGLLIGATGAIAGIPLLAAAGVLGYTAAAGYVLAPHVAEIRRKRPTDFATMSVLAGTVWFLVCLLYLAVGIALAPNWFDAATVAGLVTIPLLAGFLAQVLLGALTYLVPVVLGGGPRAVQSAGAVLDRGSGARIAVANSGLLICVLPVPSLVRVLCSILVLLALASFLPLVVLAARTSRGLRGRTSDAPHPAESAARPARPNRRLGIAAAGLGAVVFAAAAGVAADPVSLGISTVSAGPVTETGHTTSVEIRIDGMRFVPDTIEVPRGDRLVVTLNNTGTERHDLVLQNGTRTPRTDPGATATLDAGVVAGDLDGWCSVTGHRQMGMVLRVEVGTDGEGTDGEGTVATHDDHHSSDAASGATLDAAEVRRSLSGEPEPGFVARDPVLPAASPESLHRLTLGVTEAEREVSPGVTQKLWTFGGSAPGPTLRGKVGDVFEITLVNDGTIGHSVDFHAGALAPDGPMRTIDPGESLVYRFTATRSGIWLYHCSTMPMSLHIANGMFGAVVIDPPDLPPIDREYVLVQSEMYLGPQGGEADADKIAAENPDLVVWGGYANQYDHDPLQARAGERVRLWVLAAGPNRGSAFHVVGGQFDTVWAEGAYRLRTDPGSSGGSQVLGLSPAQGGFVELTFPEAGHYPFVTHSMVDAERGAHGIVEVTP
ncbi:MAG: multicopper oxidase domain-containing protein [Rhodococcus sp. (in: high G+C Gram-positive bacteria)]|uniref:multicopper oxidase domain-containing protein n=1 Tax=Rhodococcus sp. TaxID=1831 RepID=UPI003BB02864